MDPEFERLLAEARENAAITEKLNQVGAIVVSGLDRNAVVQAVTDAARELIGAQFGAFFYNVTDAAGEHYMLYTLSGVPREAFAKFPMPRNTGIFGPTFRGEAVVRSADITKDPRYGHNPPYHGMPPGHLPVRSHLAVPVKAGSGEVLGGLFFGHEETGRFTEAHERLVLGIATWAAVALENARLYQDLQEASRLKDEFLATLSHELRTPLNAVLGYARMMRLGILGPEKQTQAVDTIERNAASLAQIIDDVLDLSRITAGRIRIQPQTIDLTEVVRHALDTVLPGADAKGVAVETQFDADVPLVSGDPDRLQQVLWNLMSNAVKFTKRGGQVQVRLRRAAGPAVEIVVSDTGIGIPRAFLPHVFERFRQADVGTTREHGGLGLGLAIARHLVELHGGTIDVASEGSGRGASFCVRLPVAMAREAAESSAVAPDGVSG